MEEATLLAIATKTLLEHAFCRDVIAPEQPVGSSSAKAFASLPSFLTFKVWPLCGLAAKAGAGKDAKAAHMKIMETTCTTWPDNGGCVVLGLGLRAMSGLK